MHDFVYKLVIKTFSLMIHVTIELSLNNSFPFSMIGMNIAKKLYAVNYNITFLILCFQSQFDEAHNVRFNCANAVFCVCCLVIIIIFGLYILFAFALFYCD